MRRSEGQSCIEAISARDSVLRNIPTQHTINTYRAPEAPPLGNDQIKVTKTYCHTAPVTDAYPIRPHGPNIRWCKVLGSELGECVRSDQRFYLELLRPAHPLHIPLILVPWLLWRP